MSLRVAVDASGALSVSCGRATAAVDLHIALGRVGHGGSGRRLRTSPWDCSVGSGAGEVRKRFSADISDDAGPLATLIVDCHGPIAWVAMTLVRDLDSLAAGDTFEQSGLAAPAFTIPAGSTALVVTYGLGPSGEGAIGGYWPEAQVVDGLRLPDEAFAPLVLYEEGAALAVAPASHFLTGALVRTADGAARAVHGAVAGLPAGTCLETVFAAGDDVGDALEALGDALLARSGKSRPSPETSVLTSKLGWWNAYGGYYTEPIRPLGENRLLEAVDRLRQSAVPIAYVGLDLWYPYRVIGQALEFAPDPAKYGRGFAEIARRRGLGFVFHLSALSSDNAYEAAGGDPTFYAQVATELRRQGGTAAWHDWLRTQQHLTGALRAEPVTAERWFAGMASALRDEGLDLLLCMQTMGMVLASTALPNALAARTAIDYLFGQPEALETLAELGHPGFRNDATPLAGLRRQNLLMGSVIHALGLLPFHDLFLSSRHEGLGGAGPRTEAVLRALSCGPIGIGDGPGMTDVGLVSALVSARGTLLQPDRSPRPIPGTLGQDVEIYTTERHAGDAQWKYIVALNVGRRAASFRMPHDPHETVVWDGLDRRVVSSMGGDIEPGEMAYYVLAPLRQDISPVGLVDKFVPAPARVVRSAELDGGWRIHLEAPGERFAFASPEAPRVTADDGRTLAVCGQSGLWMVEVPESASWLMATRR